MTDAPVKHPGKILFEQVMTPLGVSRNKLARDIDVPVGRISDIVAGKRGITPDTALRFSKYFGTTAELWMRLQADYDLDVAARTTWPKAEAKVAVFQPLAPAGAEVPVSAPPVPQQAPPVQASPAPEMPSATVRELHPAGVPTPPVSDFTEDDETETDIGEDDEEHDIDIPDPSRSAFQPSDGGR